LTIADLEIERPGDGLELEMDDGTVFRLQDPKALQLDSLINMESLSAKQQVAALIADDKFDEFVKRPEVDGYFMEAIVKKFGSHYGLASLGEGSASPQSSNGNRAARRSKPTSRSVAST
jgi:hypothetical protein